MAIKYWEGTGESEDKASRRANIFAVKNTWYHFNNREKGFIYETKKFD